MGYIYSEDTEHHLTEIKRLLKEAEDERAELLKENERLHDLAGGWRPIESAPKDGTLVIIGRHMDGFGFVKGYGRFEGSPGAFCSGWISCGFDAVTGNLGLAHPTHWMPLPPPPEAA